MAHSRWTVYGVLLTGSVVIAGCAAPRALLQPSSRYHGPTIVLSGTEYMPLRLLCQALSYDCRWDRWRGTATVRGNQREVTCLVDSRAVLLNGRAGTLPYPARWYDGAVMVPLTFEQLFGGPQPQSEVVRVLQRHPIRHIVIDPGHGGKDPGAIGVGGVREKRVVLDVAQQVAEILQREGYRITLTRSTDRFIPLPERGEMANRGGADFFISIHANAHHSPRVHGVEVYYLIAKSFALEMERADHQARTARLPYDQMALAASHDTQAIVWDLLNVEYRRESVEIARAIAQHIARALGVPNGGAKAARFQVLRDSNMPAVLVEIGYLTNPTEGERLADTGYRQRLVSALTDGVLAYFRDYERTDGFSE